MHEVQARSGALQGVEQRIPATAKAGAQRSAPDEAGPARPGVATGQPPAGSVAPEPSSPPANGFGRLVEVAGLAGFLVYPFVIYLGLTRLGVGASALMLAGLAVVRLLPRLVPGGRLERGGEWLHAAALLALAVGVYASGSARVALALPVLVNLGLLVVFAHSLRRGEPVVARIARRMEGELSPGKAAHCRRVTQVWCGFFVVNGAIAGALALAAPLVWWTLYTGIVSYVLMGLLFAGEFAIRRRRFPRAASERRDWTRVGEKGSELGLRFIWLVCRTLGRGAVRTLVRAVAFYYVCSDAELRRVSREFHQRLGLHGSFGDVYRHVLRFSFCIVDRLFLLSGRTEYFEFETHGDDAVQAVLREGRGAILVGAHLGSFEALRAAAAEHAYPLSIVGNFENARRINALLEALAPELASRVIHVDRSGVSHMMRIRERVRAGELIGFLGDRMAPGAEGVQVRFLDADVEFPTGAFAVAAALSCPVFMVFCLSEGSSRYSIHCEPLELPAGSSRADRAEALQASVQRFASRLEAHVRAAPDNWFNFYDFFAARPDEPTTPAARTDG